MKMRHRLNVFVAAVTIGFKQIMGEYLPLLGAFLMFATLVVAYAGVFRWIPAEDLAAHDLTFAQLVWYLGTTEFVLFCSSFAHFKELQHEIQSDQIHLALLRPCPVWVVRLGEWSGQYGGRFIVLALPCFLLTYVMADYTAPTMGSILGMIASLPLAGFILTACSFLIGASCLWLRPAEPAFWIWQKALFLLGALLWPLAMYPSLMRDLVWLTPFPAILSVPGAWMTSPYDTSHLWGFIHQIFWTIVFIVLTALFNRAVLRRIQGDGA